MGGILQHGVIWVSTSPQGSTAAKLYPPQAAPEPHFGQGKPHENPIPWKLDDPGHPSAGPPPPNPKCPQHSPKGTNHWGAPSTPAPRAALLPPARAGAAATREAVGPKLHLPAGSAGLTGGTRPGQRDAPNPGTAVVLWVCSRCRAEHSYGPASLVSLPAPRDTTQGRMLQPLGQVWGVYPLAWGGCRIPQIPGCSWQQEWEDACLLAKAGGEVGISANLHPHLWSASLSHSTVEGSRKFFS